MGFQGVCTGIIVQPTINESDIIHGSGALHQINSEIKAETPFRDYIAAG
jgi:hypothetical protein